MGIKSIPVLMFLLLNLAPKAHAMMQKQRMCPTKFEATIKDVKDLDQNDHALAKIEVALENLKFIRGEDADEKLVVLKHGPVKFNVGDAYVIEVNGKYLCDAHTI